MRTAAFPSSPTPRTRPSVLPAALLALFACVAAPRTGHADDPPSAPSQPAGGLTAEQIADKVQAFYDSTKTFQATFEQNFTIKVQGDKKKSTGKVCFEKPGKMSWKYDAPNGNRVVSDGNTIKVYEQENQQMFETPVKDSQYPAALSFLMGQGKLTQDFTLRVLNPAEMKFEGGYVLEATPKSSTPAYQKMMLYIDGPTSQVRRALILDAQGNKNRFDFSAPVVNQAVPKGEFDFAPPAGTKVIRP